MEKHNSSKFKLDGSALDKPKSTYIEDKVESQQRTPRLVILVLSICTVAFFVWGAISQYKLISQTNKINLTDHYKTTVDKQNKDARNIAEQYDSLENVVYKLRTENDLLTENTEPPMGVFFEIQLGSFSDFNLDQYNKNLANLRQEKYDNKTKFLLGRFRSSKKARLFESDLKRMGINNAYLVGRIDDQIVTYTEALQAAKQRNK